MYAVSDEKVDMPARIAQRIRELISRGALSPGVHLGQIELADQFQTSRAPVREALKLLATEGTLNHDKNRGFFVAPLSSDEVRQLYRLRALIEAEVLASVVWPDEARLAALHEQLARVTELRADDRFRAEWAQAHRSFHDAIFDLSDQKVMVREVRRLWTLTDRYRSLLFALPRQDLRRQSIKVSKEMGLLEALAQQDLKRLQKIVDEERTYARDKLLDLLSGRGL